MEGRADGIFTDPEGTAVDEIKGIFQNLERLEEPLPLHLAQAKCYAYIYGLERKFEKIGVQMTYCQMETEEIRRFRENLYPGGTGSVVRRPAGPVLEVGGSPVAVGAETGRFHAGAGVSFSLPAGPEGDGFRGLPECSPAETAVCSGAHWCGKDYVHCVSGGAGLRGRSGKQDLYLTAKTITRTVAEEAFSILEDRGLAFKVLTITSKEKMCLLEEPDCNPAACQRARGHYDRINEAVFEILTGQSRYQREDILAQSEKWQVCPYELELELASWMDAIICDYNYVFDPDVKLRRFFGEGSRKEDFIFLIDEAHNLVERGREMYSAEVCKEDFLEMKKKVRPFSKKLERALERCNHQLLLYKRECEKIQRFESVGTFAMLAAGVLGELEDFLQDLEEGALRKEVLEFYFRVRAFVSIYDLVDSNYMVYGRHREDGCFCLKLCCVNPAGNLQNCLDRGRSAVFFSATLLPVTYYKKLLSGRGEEDYAVYIPSPFDPGKRRLLIGRDVSSRYKRRGPEEYRRIAGYIHAFVQARPGNYMVFFPSYLMLEEVYGIYREEYGGEDCLCQMPSMQEGEREEFLQAFREGREEKLLGFCVMGGIFAEGIDLSGEKLIGALVVGTGLPQISDERELLRIFYEEKGENGFDYAYRFPGMNKVLQSAGRVIRTPEDRGVIALLDDRFCGPEYRALFPREWSDAEVCTLKAVPGLLRDFWERNQG